MTEHVHAEVIRAWAGGARIQYRNIGGEWRDCDAEPNWYAHVGYRVKPAEPTTGYPQTKMSPGDIGAQLVHAMVGAPDAYDFSLHSMDRLTGFANAILKRAVDDGTVPTKEAYEQCARELHEAEKLLESLGYRRTHEGEWEAPMPETQLQRDMKVAEAVRVACIERCAPIGGSQQMTRALNMINLESIIAGVK